MAMGRAEERVTDGGFLQLTTGSLFFRLSAGRLKRQQQLVLRSAKARIAAAPGAVQPLLDPAAGGLSAAAAV